MTCRLLPWDSEHFGLRVARLDGRVLDETTAQEALAFCARERIDCLYWLATADDLGSVEVAERHGFALKDVRVTFERDLGGWHGVPDARIRRVHSDDLAALERIAAVAHTDTRFFADERFARERVAELYRTWIRKSCADSEGAVFVVDGAREAQGYISAEPDGAIGLIAVAESARRGGAATALVQAALHWFTRRGLPMASVVTQARNVAAQRLYQRAGFVTRSVELWYHCWRRD